MGENSNSETMTRKGKVFSVLEGGVWTLRLWCGINCLWSGEGMQRNAKHLRGAQKRIRKLQGAVPVD